jgi:hypothetical protein
MKDFTHKESTAAVKALGRTLEQTAGQLSAKERKALVKAVLGTIAGSKPQAGERRP